MYRFAFRTGWTALCYLSLYRFLGLLANFALCEKRTGDIVTLFKFVREKIDSEEFEGMGDIKKLGDYALEFENPDDVIDNDQSELLLKSPRVTQHEISQHEVTVSIFRISPLSYLSFLLLLP